MLFSIIEIDYLILYQLYMTWLNCSLKLHSGLRTIPHLTLAHNTQDFDSMNAYLICVIVHVQMWCVCSNICWSNPKRFLSVLFVFESDLILSYLMFCSKCIFVFFFKNWFRGYLAKSLRLRASREKGLREIIFFILSHRNSRYCFATTSWPTASREMLLG